MWKQKKQGFYQALLNKDKAYEGIFYVWVKTTGFFCHLTCAARKPRLEDYEFYKTAQHALLASFQPCKRCQPLVDFYRSSNLVLGLVDAIEKEPEKRWKDKDFKEICADDSSTVRRHFKERFGMSFVAYARARRMGIGMKNIREGSSVIDAQLDIGYDSTSGFRDAFSKIMGSPPKRFHSHPNIFKASWLDTLLGAMLAISDEEGLYLLEFLDRRGLERAIERLRIKMKSAIIPGETNPINLLKQELQFYFEGSLKEFKTPIHFLGSVFQQRVWKELLSIPYGEIKSYADQSNAMGSSSSFRALANANGANQLAIVVPYHRIIKSSRGDLAGYEGGTARKQWLIEHESNNKGK